MLLLIDAGNSNVKWATISQGQKNIEFGGGFSLSQPTESIIACFEKNWGHLNPIQIQISHVGSKPFSILLQSWIQAKWPIQPAYLKSEVRRAGLINGYSNPMQLGVDRWLALLAAHCFYKQDNKALCIVDSGTCLKVDILTAKGSHAGGYILPGKEMMIQSVEALLLLNGKSIRQTKMNGGESPPFNGSQKNTLDGITAGVDFSQIAVIEKLCRDMAKEFGPSCQIILTGGGAQALTQFAQSHAILYSPHLVLEGIAAYSCPNLLNKKHVQKQATSFIPA
tara:strand:- start:41857 stop:42696 length:840 start_codon:yes stop_codon:yes gene_type:complete